MRITVGIDPGLDGAAACLADGKALWVKPVPRDGDWYDVEAMAQLLSRACGDSAPGDVRVPIEEAVGMRGSVRHKSNASFTIGRGFGLWEAAVELGGMDLTIVPAKDWQRFMLGGAAAALGTKGASVRVAQQLFPGMHIYRTPLCRTPHHGMADALLIAAYDWWMQGGET